MTSFEKSLALNPEQTGVRMSLANALGELGRVAAAVKAYDAVLALAPAHAEALFRCGLA